MRLLASVGSVLLLMRRLGPEHYGSYSLAFATMMLLAGIGSLGVPTGAAWQAARAPASFGTTVRAASLLTLLLSTVVALAYAALTGSGATAGLTPLLTVLGVLPVMTSATMASLLQGAGRFAHANALVTGQSLLTLLLVLPLPEGSPPASALAAVVVSQYLGAMVALGSVLRASRGSRPPGHSGAMTGILRYGLQSHLGNSISLLVYRVDLFLVEMLAGRAAVGVYAAAVQMGEQLWILSNAASSVLFSRVAGDSAQDATGGTTGLASTSARPAGSAAAASAGLTARACRVVLLLTAMGAAAVAAAAVALSTWYGPSSYDGTEAALLALLPGIVALASARILASHLAARGRLTRNTVIISVALLVNVAANLVLIPRFGPTGAALASTLAYGATLLAQLWSVTSLERLPWRELLLPTRDDLARLTP